MNEPLWIMLGCAFMLGMVVNILLMNWGLFEMRKPKVIDQRLLEIANYDFHGRNKNKAHSD